MTLLAINRAITLIVPVLANRRRKLVITPDFVNCGDWGSTGSYLASQMNPLEQPAAWQFCLGLVGSACATCQPGAKNTS